MVSPFILIAHLLFASLTSFELLNFSGVLKYELHFSWLALVVVTAISWLAWTLTYRPLKKENQYFLASQAGFLTLGSVYADFIGNIYHFYTRVSWYDQFTHFLAGLAMGTITFSLLWYFNKQERLKLPFFWFILFAICISMTAGVFYEFEEYLEDHFTGTNKLGDSFDTADDLAWDFLGTLAIVIPLAILIKQKR